MRRFRDKRKIVSLTLVGIAYLLIVFPIVLSNLHNNQEIRSRAQVNQSSQNSELTYYPAAQSSQTECTADGNAEVGISYTNTDLNRTVHVTATSNGQSTDLGTIAPGETKTDAFFLGKPTIPAGTVTFTVTYTDTNQTVQQTANYSAQTCTPFKPAPSSCGNAPTDIMLIIDRSASMGQANKLVEAKNAAKNFIDVVASQSEETRVGLVSFSTDSTLNNKLTTDYGSVKKNIDTLSAQGFTCQECGITQANQEIAADGRPGIKKVVVMLTDGQANWIIGGAGQVDASVGEAKALAAVQNGYNTNQTVFFTVGLGDPNANDSSKFFSPEYMRQVAELTGGKFYFPLPSELDTVYQEISQLVGKGLIGGFVFNDDNINGTYDTNELKLTGWTITAQSNAGTKTAVSDANGNYEFPGLCDGSYQVSEKIQSGWEQTMPTTHTGYSVNIANASQFNNKEFGNTNKRTITSVTVFLDGIGNRGDNTNPTANSLSNKQPKHPIIDSEVEIFTLENQLIAKGTGSLTYDPIQGAYTGKVPIEIGFPTGKYFVKIKTSNHLRSQVNGIQYIVAYSDNPITATALIAGDMDNNNAINILDYNLLLNCFSDLTPATKCSSGITQANADLNDDGVVNLTDYNLFLREIITQPGKPLF